MRFTAHNYSPSVCVVCMMLQQKGCFVLQLGSWPQCQKRNPASPPRHVSTLKGFGQTKASTKSTYQYSIPYKRIYANVCLSSEFCYLFAWRQQHHRKTNREGLLAIFDVLQFLSRALRYDEIAASTKAKHSTLCLKATAYKQALIAVTSNTINLNSTGKYCKPD